LAEIPVSIQSKLLRVLEYHQFRPLGSNQVKKVDVKIIAATNRDLQAGIEKGEFREDLFHRLNKVHIQLPPLRSRREDIPLLVRHFLSIFRTNLSKEIKGISRQVQKLFQNYEWPGNVRELQNVLESACLVTKKEFIDRGDLPKYLQETIPVPSPMPAIDREKLTTLDGLEKEYIQHLVKITGSNLRKTASILKISRTTLYKKLKKYNISH
jgi:transcriptional regulator with PAS, ATPase and Fis domain